MSDVQPDDDSALDAIELPVSGPCVLACGPESKNTFCLTKGESAFVSLEMGDLTEAGTYQKYVEAIAKASERLGVVPEIAACDLHPDYVPTRYARQLDDVSVEPVQHHHAHIAACMVEHGLQTEVIGIAFDGMGYGDDGTMWGGEFLLCDLRHSRRCAHLKQYVMPGGDSATLYPERMAFSYLVSEQQEAIESLLPGIDTKTGKVLRRMIEGGIRAPYTSSAGRLFDAVSAMLGVKGMIVEPGRSSDPTAEHGF